MKQSKGTSAALAALVSSLATLGCCFPLGFAASLGTAGASPFFGPLRPWLLGLSVALIGLGFWQQRSARQCALKGRALGEVLLWTAVFVLLAVVLFPQQIAGLLADWRPT